MSTAIVSHLYHEQACSLNQFILFVLLHLSDAFSSLDLLKTWWCPFVSCKVSWASADDKKMPFPLILIIIIIVPLYWVLFGCHYCLAESQEAPSDLLKDLSLISEDLTNSFHCRLINEDVYLHISKGRENVLKWFTTRGKRHF